MKSATPPSSARSRPVGITLLAMFFLAGAIVCIATILALRFPNGPLGPMWAFNPRARAGFEQMGWGAYVLMVAVGITCALSSVGIWAGAHWGRWLAIGLLSVNLVSDFANAILARDARTLIGVPIAGVLILYLARSASVLRYFDGRRGTAGPSADP